MLPPTVTLPQHSVLSPRELDTGTVTSLCALAALGFSPAHPSPGQAFLSPGFCMSSFKTQLTYHGSTLHGPCRGDQDVPEHKPGAQLPCELLEGRDFFSPSPFPG